MELGSIGAGMNAEARFPGFGAAEKPLLTMGDVRKWKEQVRSYKQRREEHLNSVKALDQDIEALEKKLSMAELFMAEEATGAAIEAAHEAPVDAPVEATPPRTQMYAPLPPRRKRSNLESADSHMREVATRIAAEHPEGFSASDFIDLFKADESVPLEHRKVHRTYFYTALKRICVDGLLSRRFDRYYAPGKAPPESVPAAALSTTPIEGYKLVPLTKQERVREELRRYLKHRKGRTSHRAQLADQLVQLGVLGTEKNIVQTVSVYLAKWPEFVADGNGNITLDVSAITNGDP